MPGTVGMEDRRVDGQDRILTNRMVTIISGHGGDVLQADTVNLGPGGMFVATEKDFDIGDRFICRIDLGEPYKPILSGAEVRWLNHTSDHRGMGVRFLDIAEAANSLSGELPVQGPETVKVRLDSVGPALDGEVIERQERALVVDVELPFLGTGAQVEVGPNIAARSAAISEVEWIPSHDVSKAKMRLKLDMERTDVEVTTDRVVQDRRASEEEESEKLEVVRLYSREPRGDRSAAPAEPEPEPVKRPQKPRKLKKNKKVSNWARRSQLLNWTDRDQETAESRTRARREAEVVADPPRAEELEGVDEVTVGGEVEEEPIVVEASAQREVESRFARSPSEDRAAPSEEPAEGETKAEPRAAAASEEDASDQTEARSEAKRAEAKKDARCDETPDKEEEEIDSSEFSPLRGALERVLGVAVATRIMAFLATLKPRLIVAAQWSKAKAIKGWGWTKAKAGPALVRGLKATRKGLKAARKRLSRPRRQDRGEPSKIVRNLTDRARKAAAGRGKSVAVVLLVVVGLAGLGAAGYGLLGNSSTEEQRQELQSEAQRSGWTSERWQEPEPAPNS
jgi:hypothetical protein